MSEQFQVIIESVDFEGKGIARIDGKTIFVDGALAGEEVVIEIIKRRASFDKAKLIEIIKASPARVTPECPNYGICGGCSMQHISFEEQIRVKQKVLIDNLAHIGKVEAEEILAPLKGVSWGYRHRGRLSARYVMKKGGALVGFREKNGPYVADMHECRVLPPHVSALIDPLRDLVSALSIRDRVPQIEIAVGLAVTILVVRNMDVLNSADEELVKDFVNKYTIADNVLQVWLQPKGPETCYPFYPVSAPTLSYEIQKFNINMPYYPSEFTQVNPYINEQMVGLALDLLNPQGNFTLPIARHAKQVVGIEGADALVKRALQNATYNSLADKVAYQVCNLFKIDEKWVQELGHFDKWLIDPPRDGAAELCDSITPEIAPRLIVYVSCNPATLARDASILVNKHGYKLRKAGVMNMFPHPSHVESIAFFELV